MAKKFIFAAAVVVLDVLAAISLASGFTPDDSEKIFQSDMTQGQQLEEQQLYGRAINAYRAADNIHDSCELRMKIAELYGKGYENGEFDSLSYKESVLKSVVNTYPTETEAYDQLVKIYTVREDDKQLARLVKYSRSQNISTELLEDAREKVRHKYEINVIDADMLESVGPYWISRRTDETDNGYEEGVEKKAPQSVYTFYYEDGTVSEDYRCIEMSAPTGIEIGENESYNYYFVKDYGNDITVMEKSDEVYSSIYRSGVRRSYIDGDREGYYQFGSGMISLYNKDTGKWDIFDIDGKLCRGDYDEAGTFGNGYMLVTKGENSRIINTKFEDVFGVDVTAVTGFGGRCSINSRMFIRKSGESSYKMYDTGSLSETGFECDNADLFIEDLAAFEKNGKWGFVNTSGNVVIEPAYDEAKSFRHGYAAVRQGDMWGFINKSGEMIVEPAFEDALYFLSDGSAFVRNEGSYYRIRLFYNEEEGNG